MLTREQYDNARKKFSHQQIVDFEKQRSGQPLDDVGQTSMISGESSSVPQQDIQYNTEKELTPTNIYNKVKTLPSTVLETLPVSMETIGGFTGQSLGGTGGGALLGGGAAAGGEYLKQQIQKDPRNIAKALEPAIPGISGVVAPNITPTTMEEFKEIARVGKNAGIRDLVYSGIFGLAKGAFKMIPKIKAGFMSKIQKVFRNQRIKYGDEFGNSIKKIAKEQPDVRVDLYEQVDKLKVLEDTNTNVSPAIRAGEKKLGRGRLSELIENPELARNLELEDALDIKRTIQGSPTLKRGYKTGEFTPGDIDLLDFVDDVDNTILDKFPKVASENKEFHKALTQWNTFKNYLRTGKTSGAMAEGGKSMREVQIWRQNIVPFLKDNPQMVTAMQEYFGAIEKGKLVGKAIPYAAAAWGLEKVRESGRD